MLTKSTLLSQLRLPLIASPMFIVSSMELVIQQCISGVVGSFPALNAREDGELDYWLSTIVETLDAHNQKKPDTPAAPFAVNQIVHRSNHRLEQDMELCVKHKVPIVITSLGANEQINEAAHSYGGLVLHDVINQKFAKKAIEKGADGLIAVATGAGGHAGTISPFALLQEIRQWFDGIVALSGCIATGDAILAAQAMGADFAYMGSSFIATKEANAVSEYKQMIVDSSADDIVYSDFFTGVHGNYLKPSISAAGLDADDLPHPQENKLSKLTSENQTKKAWKDIWGCGQGIGVIDKVQTTAEKITQLENEYLAVKARLL